MCTYRTPVRMKLQESLNESDIRARFNMCELQRSLKHLLAGNSLILLFVTIVSGYDVTRYGDASCCQNDRLAE